MAARSDYFQEFENCQLCEHGCGVNRIKGEMGICRSTLPVVASATLHPAPPESYTVFMAGCNFKCLNCQNWSIAHYPDTGYPQRGQVDCSDLAQECVVLINSVQGRLMGADRIFFSGGEATIHLPYIEKVVVEARKLDPQLKVNFDTNGYLTEKSLERVLSFATSITFDLKAYHNEVHQALTGASAKPVLRNAAIIAKQAPEKIWEYRILVIPQINEAEIQPLTDYIASLNVNLPVCFLAFRPNFVLEEHPGATRDLMDRCLAIAHKSGLTQVHWSGQTNIKGRMLPLSAQMSCKYTTLGAQLAASRAAVKGCATHPRNCVDCPVNQTCQLKKFIPVRQT